MNLNVPSFDPAMLVALLPVGLLTLGLVAFCLIDLARRPQVHHLPKALWALIVILVIPLGPVLYLVAGRAGRRPVREEELR